MKSDRIIKINKEKIKDHLGEFVRGTVEETLNAMLDAEADAICNAQKYEHTRSIVFRSGMKEFQAVDCRKGAYIKAYVK